MKRSIVAKAIHPFKLHPLLKPDSASDADWDGASDSPGIQYEQDDHPTLSELSSYLLFWRERDISLNVVMAAIALHITREAAAKSGLFGLLGDAPIQLIDIADEVTLIKYEELYRQNHPDKEPKVERLFELFRSPAFKTAVGVWQKQAEWLMFASMWHDANPRYNAEWVGLDKASLWVPPLHERNYIRMSCHLPNETHWWVKQAKDKMAILKPQIMVHFCTKDCYIEGQLEEDFKSGWKF